MEINLEKLREKDRITINNEEFEVVKIEENYRYDDKKDEIENKGKTVYLHKLNEKELLLFHTINISKNGDIKLFKTTRRMPKYPKDIPKGFKHKIEDYKEVKIKTIKLKWKQEK